MILVEGRLSQMLQRAYLLGRAYGLGNGTLDVHRLRNVVEFRFNV
jgi:hypothetical protein